MPTPVRQSPVIHGHDGIPSKVPWGAVIVYIGVTFAGISAVALAWSRSGDMNNEADALLFGGLGMCTPTLGLLIAATVTGEIRRPGRLLTSTGISRPASWTRLARFLAIALLLPFALLAATLAIATSTGTYRFHEPFPAGPLVSELITNTVTFVPLLVLVFGEEWGWGYLLTRLLPLGLLRGILLSGLIWGLFHAPLTLQGYLYLDLPGPVGAALFTVGSILLGCVMAWIRIASGSLWPAVILHGSSNLLVNPIPAVVGAAVDPRATAFHTSIPGSWPSWIALSTVIAVLVVTGRFRALSPHPEIRPSGKSCESRRGPATGSASGTSR